MSGGFSATGSLVELTRKLGRKLSSFAPAAAAGHSNLLSQSTLQQQQSRLALSRPPSLTYGPCETYPLSGPAQAPSPSNSSLRPTSQAVVVVVTSRGDTAERATSYGSGHWPTSVDATTDHAATRASSSQEEAGHQAAADTGVRNRPCMYIGESYGEDQTDPVLGAGSALAGMSRASMGCDLRAPLLAAEAEAADLWIASGGSGLQVVALKMGDFRYAGSYAYGATTSQG